MQNVLHITWPIESITHLVFSHLSTSALLETTKLKNFNRSGGNCFSIDVASISSAVGGHANGVATENAVCIWSCMRRAVSMIRSFEPSSKARTTASETEMLELYIKLYLMNPIMPWSPWQMQGVGQLYDFPDEISVFHFCNQFLHLGFQAPVHISCGVMWEGQLLSVQQCVCI